MNESILWVLEVAILPGKLEDFRAVARDLIASTQNEADTLIYDWHLNADGTRCHIIERYRNSAAFVKHCRGFATFAERFFASCKPIRFDVYGSPSAEARAEIDGLSPNYYTLLGGASR